jgi:hypothetical protein
MTDTSSSAAAPSAQTGHRQNPQASRSARFPILIGISGKRTFDAQDAEADRATAQALAKRFATLFAALDRDLPQTPKVLLTGAAFGSDLIAAEAALRMGPQWAVAAILPFERALFEEDFYTSASEPAWRQRYAEHLAALKRLLGEADKPNPRVLVRELPKLAGASGGAATTAELARDAEGGDSSLRRNHYEQVGQYIAEIATIMIAVMAADEKADTAEANGGTARIAAYRRAGFPDALGTAVARGSQVLRHQWCEVSLPPAGYLWLMEPQKAAHTGSYPVTVLPPLTDRDIEEVYAGYPGQDLPREQEDYVGPLRSAGHLLGAAWPGASGEDADTAALRRLRGSLVVARGVERMHRERPGPRTPEDANVMADASPLANVADALHAARALLSARQRQVNVYVRRGFHVMAAAFVVAVLVFESYAKLFHERHALLGIYLFVLLVIGIQALRGRWMLWEAVAEDYRAVAESLRVQRAWWAAGLKARVDWEHLQGVGQDLSPIRDCTKMIAGWVALRHGWDEADRQPDWVHVRGKAAAPRDLRKVEKPPPDWVGSQLWYFIHNAEDRERRVQISDAGSWCLFVMSGALAALLWMWSVRPEIKTQLGRMAHIRLPHWTEMFDIDASFIVWLALVALVITFRVWNHDVRRPVPQSFLTGITGAAAAAAFALAMISAKPLLVRWTGLHEDDQAVTYVTLASLVVISAVAGAYRYLMERLNVEAEALDYRDARGRFERAERLLARGADSTTGAPADEAAAQRIVHELGRLALMENEAWLKSRRERPLTPVVG